jgi:hypothetical protein
MSEEPPYRDSPKKPGTTPKEPETAWNNTDWNQSDRYFYRVECLLGKVT